MIAHHPLFMCRNDTACICGKCQNGTIFIAEKCQLCYTVIEVMAMTIKELRKEKGMTQSECADFLHIPTRTYKRYESDDSRVNPMKYEYIISRLREYGLIDEDHGKLTIEQIREICGEVFKEYSVEYAYVFGSYAKGTATEKSDVDILISVPTDGLKFFELVEVLREKLKKRVDLLDEGQLENNTALTHEILKYGVKIYG